MHAKITHISDINQEKVEMHGVKDAYIQWLISDKDSAPNFAMRRFVVKANGFTPYHNHPYEHEVYILNGEGEVRIEDKTFKIKKDFVIFVPPNAKHQFINTGNTDLIFICVIPLQKRN